MARPPRVSLRLPTVLATVVGFDRVDARGGTLLELLEAAFELQPRLRHHLMHEGSDELRPHVLCLVNGESVPRDEVTSTALADGDEVWIHQAISGG